SFTSAADRGDRCFRKPKSPRTAALASVEVTNVRRVMLGMVGPPGEMVGLLPASYRAASKWATIKRSRLRRQGSAAPRRCQFRDGFLIASQHQLAARAFLEGQRHQLEHPAMVINPGGVRAVAADADQGAGDGLLLAQLVDLVRSDVLDGER